MTLTIGSLFSGAGMLEKSVEEEVSTADRDGKQKFHLEADANHPDAAKRVHDAFRWYGSHELTAVSGE